MLHKSLTVTSHGGSLWPGWCVLVLLPQDFDVPPAELQDLLSELCAALMTRLLNSVAQQHQSPRQAQHHQQHTQLLGHVPPGEHTQHGTGGTEGGGTRLSLEFFC